MARHGWSTMMTRSMTRLVAAVLLLPAPARGQDPCTVKTQYDAADKKVKDAETALDALLAKQGKAPGTRLPGDEKALTAQQATLQPDPRVAEAEGKLKEFDESAIRGLRLAEYNAKKEAREKEIKALDKQLATKGDVPAKLTKAREQAATEEEAIKGKVRGVDVEDLDKARAAVADAGTEANTLLTNLLTAYQNLRNKSGADDLPENSLSEIRFTCQALTDQIGPAETARKALKDARAANKGASAAEQWQQSENMRTASDAVQATLRGIQSAVATCQAEASAGIGRLDAQRRVPEQIDPDGSVTALQAKREKLMEEQKPSPEIEQLTRERAELEAKVTAAKKGGPSDAELARNASQREEIQKNIDLQVATRERDALTKGFTAAEGRKADAVKAAQAALNTANALTTPEKAAWDRIRASLKAELLQRPAFKEDVKKFKAQRATLPDRAAKVSATEKYKQDLGKGLDRRATEGLKELKVVQATVLLTAANTLVEFDCWSDAAALYKQLGDRARELSGKAAVATGADFEFNGYTGDWQDLPPDDEEGGELPDDIAKYTTEERVFAVRPGQWLSTGIHLKQGESFGITATGTIKADASWMNREWGPSGFYWLGFAAYTLKGLVGGKLIEIGSGSGGTAPADGELQLGITRTYEKINAEDSRFQGFFKVTVTVQKPRQ